MLSIFLAAIVGGLLNRWRGGWLPWPESHNARRFGLTLALTAFVAYWTLDPFASAAALLLFPGLLPGWGRWFDMGRVQDDDDLLGLTGRGMVLTAPTGLALALLGHGPWAMVCGGLMGPTYWLAWWIHDRVDLRRNSFLDGPTSLGEILFMAWVFAVVGLSVQ